ncbi:MAG: hypothetical protein ACKPKO_22880, partial [Candidatus Fonsibacter sp.]
MLYSDTDSLVYSIQHDDIYEFIKQNKQHFDLSDSIRTELKDNTNKKGARQIQGRNEYTNHDGIYSTEPEGIFDHSPNSQRVQRGEIKNKKTLKGVSKVVVKKEIKHDDYVNVIETNNALTKEVMSIRSSTTNYTPLSKK